MTVTCGSRSGSLMTSGGGGGGGCVSESVRTGACAKLKPAAIVISSIRRDRRAAMAASLVPGWRDDAGTIYTDLILAKRGGSDARGTSRDAVVLPRIRMS